MAYTRKEFEAHDGDRAKKLKKNPRRMRAEHKVIKESRYKGDYLPEKINDVEDRISFLNEDMHSATDAERAKMSKGRKGRQRKRAYKKLEKRRDEYRAEWHRQNPEWGKQNGK